jgi:2-hydroxychromene-2-carboxylate isomerase
MLFKQRKQLIQYLQRLLSGLYEQLVVNSEICRTPLALFRIAKNLKLDMNVFTKDFRNNALSVKIKENILKLESAGIYGTPTIMINNRLIFNSTSIYEIENTLKEEMEKVKKFRKI